MKTEVTTLALDPTDLPDNSGVLKQMVAELLATFTQLRTTIDKQQAHIQYLVRLSFGRRTERVDGPTLFDLSAPAEEAVSAPPPEVPGPQGVEKRRGHGRRPRRADLPREREVLDLTEAEKTCPCCGDVRVCIGGDVSERLDYRPACLFVHVLEPPTYLCRRCEQHGDNIQAVQAPLPPEPIPRGTVSAGLLAHVLVSKWFDHLPLYRLEGILARIGWNVSRSTLCDQMMRCAELLTPLYDLLCHRVRASFALHADDTPIALLHSRRTASTRGPTSNTSSPPRRRARAMRTSATCCPTPGRRPVRTRCRLSNDPRTVTARRPDLRCRAVPCASRRERR
jgi:transposase